MLDLAGLKTEVQKRASGSPWIWCYQIQLESTKVSRPTAFLTSFNEEVTLKGFFGFPDRTYYPFPLTHTAIRQDTQGDLPTVDLTLSNAGRGFARYMEVGQGFIGAPVTIFLAHYAHVTVAADRLEWAFQVRSSAISEEVVTLSLAQPDFYRMPIPAGIFLRSRCRWLYKGPECGYLGALPTCSKRLDGTNGCNAHGADEIATGAPIRHPANFGAFPAMPRAR